MLTKLNKQLLSLAYSPISFIKRLIFFTGVLVWLGLGVISAYAYQLYQLVPSEDSLSFASIRSHAQSIILANSINAKNSNKIEWIELKDVNRDLLYAIVLSLSLIHI